MFVYELKDCGFESRCSHLKTSDIAPVSNNEFLDIQPNIECRFILKCVHGMIRIYSQMHCADKCSQHTSIIQTNIECGFTLKCVRDIIRTNSQMHRTDMYSQHSFNHLASLAKWLSVRLRIKRLWVRVPLQSLKL